MKPKEKIVIAETDVIRAALGLVDRDGYAYRSAHDGLALVDMGKLVRLERAITRLRAIRNEGQ